MTQENKETLKVLLVKNGETLDISNLVESVEWSGSRSQAPRTLQVSLANTDRGMHESITVENGNGLMLLLEEKEYFRGIVFQCDYTPTKLSITAYDQMIYLLKNKDSMVFSGKKASDIIKKICGDFSIPVGTIADTGHTIKNLVFDGDSLFDMAVDALKKTFAQTGKRYAFFSREGKVHLIPREENVIEWVVESGTNLVNYSFSASIEETVNKVKLQAGEEQKAITAIADDPASQQKYGVLQHFEKVKDKVNLAKLTERALTILKTQGKEKRTFSVDDLTGSPDVVSGTAIFVSVPELQISKAYFVEEDRHSFSGQRHSMSLTLVETADM
ncbi:MAG: phage portal protein [Clostridia bacterium]